MSKDEKRQQQIEKCFAERDYLKALDLIDKTGEVSDHSRQQIDKAIGKLNTLAASEFAAGRWSVAEEIFGAVQQHMHMMDPERMDELWMLIQELARCRESERGNAMMAAATRLASEKLYAEAYEVAIGALKVCDDAPMASRLRRFLGNLPHPGGYYLHGFDSPLDLRQHWTSKGGAVLEILFERDDNIRGGLGRFTLPPKSGMFLKEIPEDWSNIESVRMLVRSGSDAPTPFALQIESPTGGLMGVSKAKERNWATKILPIARFTKHGRFDPEDVRMIGIVNPSGEAVELFLDEIRIQPEIG